MDSLSKDFQAHYLHCCNHIIVAATIEQLELPAVVASTESIVVVVLDHIDLLEIPKAS